MELINKADLIRTLVDEIAETGNFYSLTTIREFPTIDVETAVIRCDRCRYGREGAWGYHCDYWNTDDHTNFDYCSRGKE